MRKSSEKIALIILIPMIIFTLIITLRNSKTQATDNTPKQTIQEFFNAKSQKDIKKVSAVLADTSSLSILQSEIDNLYSIKLIHAQEEKDKIIRSTYLKYNNEISDENLKVYKIKYDAKYIIPSEQYKNGLNDTWLFLIRENKNWLIDL